MDFKTPGFLFELVFKIKLKYNRIIQLFFQILMLDYIDFKLEFDF